MMGRTVVLRVVGITLCLGVMATPAFAKPVKHGAMDVCFADGGEIEITNNGFVEQCCAYEQIPGSSELGPLYCVTCDPPGSDNCELTTISKAADVQVTTILLNRALEGQRTIRQELDSLPAKIKDLCAPSPSTTR